MTTVTDRIEKKVLLRAPLSRVWRALTDSQEFGDWFGVKFDAPFEVGVTMRGLCKPTTADAEVAEMQKPYEGTPFTITVVRIEPERVFAFTWNPFAIEPGVDYSAEEPTVVTFELTEEKGGVLLTVTETGFDRIPLARRAKAFAANEGGWAAQVGMIAKHLAHAAHAS